MIKKEIQEKNDKIVKTVFKIMDILHDSKTGFDALRPILRRTTKNNVEYEKAKEDTLNKMAAKHGATPSTPYDEKIFMLTGADIMQNHIYFSCGNAAKAFCYVNSTLPQNERLDVEVMITINEDNLVDAMAGHTVPIVKMADGEYRAIDPAVTWTESHITGPFIPGKIKIGNTIEHILPGMQGKKYRIVKFATWRELEGSLSKFKNFLRVSSVRHGKTKIICATLESVLQNMPRRGPEYFIYDFCNEIKRKTSLPIHIVSAKNERGNESRHVLVELDGNFYVIDRNRDYLMLIPVKPRDGKTFVIGVNNPTKYTVVWDKSPAEYLVDAQKANTGRAK